MNPNPKITPTPNPALEPTPLMVLEIDGTEFLLPPGSDIPNVLKALAGLRRIRCDHFFYLEPSVRTVELLEEVEIGVASWRRTLVTAEQAAEFKRRNKEAIEERATRAEAKKAAV